MANTEIAKELERLITGLEMLEGKGIFDSKEIDVLKEQIEYYSTLNALYEKVLVGLSIYKERIDCLKLKIDNNITGFRKKVKSIEAYLESKGSSPSHITTDIGGQKEMLMSPTQMSKEWGVTYSKVYRILRWKKLKWIKEGKKKLYHIAPEIKELICGPQKEQSTADEKKGQTSIQNYMTIKEIVKKYGFSDATFYNKTKGITLEKTSTYPKRFKITAEIDAILSNKYNKRAIMDNAEIAHDIRMNPIALNKINLDEGAYLSIKQLSKMFCRKELGLRVKLKKMEHDLKTEHLGDHKILHYLVNNSNKNIFEKYGKKGEVNVYDLCRELNVSQEEMFKRLTDNKIMFRHSRKDTGVPYIPIKDAQKIRELYKG